MRRQWLGRTRRKRMKRVPMIRGEDGGGEKGGKGQSEYNDNEEQITTITCFGVLLTGAVFTGLYWWWTVFR